MNNHFTFRAIATPALPSPAASTRPRCSAPLQPSTSSQAAPRILRFLRLRSARLRSYSRCPSEESRGRRRCPLPPLPPASAPSSSASSPASAPSPASRASPCLKRPSSPSTSSASPRRCPPLRSSPLLQPQRRPW